MTKENAENKGAEMGSFRSGYIAIIGRPNVGKSTLLNQLLGEKVAIVTPKPQTTRNRITGIRTSPKSQIVFIDTPGIHQAHSLMNRRMVEVALQTLHEVDGVFWLLDSRERIGPEEERIVGIWQAQDSEFDSAQQDRSCRQRQIAAADAALL